MEFYFEKKVNPRIRVTQELEDLSCEQYISVRIFCIGAYDKSGELPDNITMLGVTAQQDFLFLEFNEPLLLHSHQKHQSVYLTKHYVVTITPIKIIIKERENEKEQKTLPWL